MTQETPLEGMPLSASDAGIPPTPPVPDINRTLLEPLNHGIAAATRTLLKLGVSAERVIELHLNQLCSVIAQLEPHGLRVKTIEDVVKSFAPLVRQHVEAARTTPGGIIKP